jgi:hypothetical protein
VQPDDVGTDTHLAVYRLAGAVEHTPPDSIPKARTRKSCAAPTSSYTRTGITFSLAISILPVDMYRKATTTSRPGGA